jgi:uncharacterized protein (TIGR02646 family)
VIRIDKTLVASPENLANEGAAECVAFCAAYDAGRREFRSEEFKQSIYAHQSVKTALIEAQHGKCAFCEKIVFDAGTIEHYRPKTAVQQSRGGRIIKPGYYWLAYEWSNLLLCCGECNTGHKRILFPLSNPSTRARCHTDNLASEDPLLINPAESDPQLHISWRGVVPFSLDDYGSETINVLRLDNEDERKDLLENRRSHLANLLSHRYILDIADELADSPRGIALLERARLFLAESEEDAAPFAAMARAAIRSGFRDALTVTDGSVR